MYGGTDVNGDLVDFAEIINLDTRQNVRQVRIGLNMQLEYSHLSTISISFESAAHNDLMIVHTSCRSHPYAAENDLNSSFLEYKDD